MFNWLYKKYHADEWILITHKVIDYADYGMGDGYVTGHGIQITLQNKSDSKIPARINIGKFWSRSTVDAVSEVLFNRHGIHLDADDYEVTLRERA